MDISNIPNEDGKYLLSKFIGRVVPFTEAHKEIIERAFSISEFVSFDVGTCFQPRMERTPFTFDERCEMIMGAFSREQQKRIILNPIMDSPYSDTEWQSSIQKSTLNSLETIGAPTNPSVALIGHKKDFGTSFYLDMFPQYGSVGVENLRDNLSATTIRNNLYANRGWNGELNHLVPKSTASFLSNFSRTDDFKDFMAEIDYYHNYRRAHERAARLIEQELGYYSEIKFQTVDSMLVQSGHVLLIERKTFPGKGLMALPGGFLDDGEWIKDGKIRETREETKLKVPTKVLRGSEVATMRADYPHRSARGRVISDVTLYKLEDGPLPVVRGRSDAKVAKWVPIADIRPENMFEDHFHIVKYLLAKIKN